MRNVLFVLGLVSILFLSGNSGATLYDFQPRYNDLGDLDHEYNYIWGIEWSVPDGEQVSGVSLEFNNIRNWDNNENVLYVHLLENAYQEIVRRFDNQGGGDHFAGQGVELFTWHNLPDVAQDLSYSLSPDEIIYFETSISDGNAGFAFDPDCHFWNDGVTLRVETYSAHITTGSVPEPDMLMLQIAGLLVYVIYRRKRG